MPYECQTVLWHQSELFAISYSSVLVLMSTYDLRFFVFNKKIGHESDPANHKLDGSDGEALSMHMPNVFT